MNRKEAREAVFRTIFGWEFNREQPLSAVWEQAEQYDAFDTYASRLISLTQEHIDEIEHTIEQYAKGWKLARISHVSRSALTLAVCEMFYFDDIPLLVSLDEAVELAKRYDDTKAYGFVNGVLNSVMSDSRAVDCGK